jgi:hypothetical protein
MNIQPREETKKQEEYKKDKLIITVGEARKLLGSESYELTDEEVLTLIKELQQLAVIFLT